MQAALLYKFGEALRVEEVARPLPLADELLVQVEACGVCHSDLHMVQGDWPDVAAKMQFPAILGHEVVGRVVKTGRDAKGFAAGERVGVGWLHWTCGECEPCRDGAENICLKRLVTGIAAPGGFAELIRIKASHALHIPEALVPEEAAPLFCAGLTVFHALRNAGVLGAASSAPTSHTSRGIGPMRVAVFGIGGLGHLAIQLARNIGAEVTAVDVSEAKLEQARSLGAVKTIHAASKDAAKQLRAAGGPHVAMVTAASKTAYDLALRALRKRGTLAVVGLPKEDVSFNADNFVVGEYRIVGSAVGTRDEMRELLGMAEVGKVRCEVETHTLSEINDIFGRMGRREIPARAVIRF